MKQQWNSLATKLNFNIEWSNLAMKQSNIMLMCIMKKLRSLARQFSKNKLENAQSCRKFPTFFRTKLARKKYQHTLYLHFLQKTLVATTYCGVIFLNNRNVQHRVYIIRNLIEISRRVPLVVLGLFLEISHQKFSLCFRPLMSTP